MCRKNPFPVHLETLAELADAHAPRYCTLHHVQCLPVQTMKWMLRAYDGVLASFTCRRTGSKRHLFFGV
jgi:hypothetical protein